MYLHLYVWLVPDNEYIVLCWSSYLDRTTYASVPTEQDFKDIMQKDEQHEFDHYPTTTSAES